MLFIYRDGLLIEHTIASLTIIQFWDFGVVVVFIIVCGIIDSILRFSGS